MRYVLMICTDEERGKAMPPAEMAGWLEEYGKFMGDMQQRGVLLGGERLRWTDEAVTVSAPNGKVLVSDGPFAETKEQIGGFFLVDCKDRDEAIEIAAKIPAARIGRIEVRPVWEM